MKRFTTFIMILVTTCFLSNAVYALPTFPPGTETDFAFVGGTQPIIRHPSGVLWAYRTVYKKSYTCPTLATNTHL